MYSILFYSVSFLNCVNALGKPDGRAGVNLETVTDLANLNETISPAMKSRMKPVKHFRLSHLAVGKLRSLNANISDLVATYESPPTFKPTVNVDIFRIRMKKRSNKPFATPRPSKITTKGIYHTKSHWPSHKERRDVLHIYFLEVFSQYDDEKRVILSNVTTVGPGKKGKCYMETYKYFLKHCYYHYYVLGGMKRMKKLLIQACSVEWLNADKINRVFQTCCRQRFKFVKFHDL